MRVAAAYILVWVGRTKSQFFTTNHEVTENFVIFKRWTILYACKWYKSTVDIFVDIGAMSRNIENFQTNSESLRLLLILENTEHSLTQVDFSHKKHLPFSPI